MSIFRKSVKSKPNSGIATLAATDVPHSPQATRSSPATPQTMTREQALGAIMKKTTGSTTHLSFDFRRRAGVLGVCGVRDGGRLDCAREKDNGNSEDNLDLHGGLDLDFLWWWC
ncbi:hypothetical protein BG003_000203 [Podila horticola]|nr:hypothetical protein BG003_000203 [Podila horticola]